MARKSPAALAAELWRSGPNPPKPPADLTGPGKAYWSRLITSKPADHWTGASLILLDRLCRSLAAVDQVQKQLDANPSAPNAMQLVKAIVALNASCAGLAQKLRLTPQAVIGPRETGRNAETGTPVESLIGGYAIRQ
jgi:hypothetical protein